MTLALAAGMSVGGSLLVMGAALAVCLLLVLADRLMLAPTVLVSVEDVVTTPGKPISLRACAEREILPFCDPLLAGVGLKLHVIEAGVRREIASAVTGADGLAHFPLGATGAPARARYVVTVAPPHRGLDAPIVVDVIEPDARVFVIDIDGTIARTSAFMQAVRENARIRPLKDAPDCVQRLARTFVIVYLTARDHIFRAKTLEWLIVKGFPEAPLLLRRKRFWTQKAVDHKRERLAEMAAQVKLTAGVGDLATDALVYKERGMRAYIIGRGTIDGATTARDWSALLEAVSKGQPPG